MLKFDYLFYAHCNKYRQIPIIMSSNNLSMKKVNKLNLTFNHAEIVKYVRSRIKCAHYQSCFHDRIPALPLINDFRSQHKGR